IGIYRQYELRKGPRPDGEKKQFHGHVYIELEDNGSVILFPIWDRSCFRDKKEIKRYEGKKVRLVGVIHQQSPNRPGPRPAQNIMASCLTDLEEIDFAPEESPKLDFEKK
ncbi:MAG: hypothetical protein AAF570_06805, partial [Bacteroidota bacterium]